LAAEREKRNAGKPALAETECLECKRPLVQTRRTQKFCCFECRNRWKTRNYYRLHEAYRHADNGRRKVQYQQRRLEEPWKPLLDGVRRRAEKRGMPFDLTAEWALARWTGRCELSNIPFAIGMPGGTPFTFHPSIDKIEPKLGYVQSNCRFILWSLNAFKGSTTDEDMYSIAEALLSNRKS